MERWNAGPPQADQKDTIHFYFIVNPVGGGTINPTLHYPLRARFQPVGLQAGFLLVELTARREGRLYEPEARTHYSAIKLHFVPTILSEP